MSTNNSTSTCWTYSESFTSTEQFIAYKFLIPFYLIADLFGRSLFLAAVYKHAKTEHMYFYQVVRAMVEWIQVPFRALICVYDAIWNSGTFSLPSTISRSYAAMWLFSRIIFIMSAINTLTISLAVCMAADRVFALVFTYRHAQINHRRHRTAAIASCCLISLMFSAVDFFRFDILTTPNGGFTFAFNQAYAANTAVYALGLCRTLLQTILTLLLFALNIALLYYYRTKFVSSTAVIAFASKTDEQQNRKQSEKTLLMLTLLECSFMLVEKTMLVLAAIFVYVFPNFYLCIKSVFVVANDGILMSNDLLDFYATFVICKQFRAMVRNVFRGGSSQVVPLRQGAAAAS